MSPPARRRPLRLAVLASGRGSNLQSLLDHAAAGRLDARVGLVVSDRPDAACLDVARRGGVPAVATLTADGRSRDAYDARLLELLRAEAPDLVVLAGFMRILGPSVCAGFRDRIINVHPALLPAFRGARGIQDALDAGVRVTGCTTHLVTQALDAGPILMQAACLVRQDDAPASLRRRVQALEHALLPATIQLFAQGRVRVTRGRVRIAPGPTWPDPGVPGTLWPEPA